MTTYNIGTGIADVTDSAVGLGMQGMADPGQRVTGVELRQYSRAFIISEQNRQQRVAIVVADIWTCVEAVKSEVIRRLKLRYDNLYHDANVLISGTHTHSGPGGFSYSKLYETAPGGYDPHTHETIVAGIFQSIVDAHVNLAPGKIYVNKGIVPDCGRQRSAAAYKNNADAANYKNDTDKEMLLLKFVDAGGKPIGCLNWFAIHPTDMGQKNTLISGDNKGWASHMFEKQMGATPRQRKTFVVAFANANCGDVSGNVEFGHIPDGKHDSTHAKEHGRRQFETARQLFGAATQEVHGSIDFRHTRVDMANVSVGNGRRTWPAALGLAFAAGSTEDSVPRIKLPIVDKTIDSFHLKEGLRDDKLSVDQRAAQGVIISGLALTFGITINPPEFVRGHRPKAIILAPGKLDEPIVPSILPLQLLKVGNVAMAGIPAEMTTMAGRRLRDTVLSALSRAQVDHVALATYANDYSMYITTKAEYDMQHYEGGCTLFGPYTLMAYQQEFKTLAVALAQGKPISAGVANRPLPIQESNKRLTIRNLSNKTAGIKFYKQGDPFFLTGLPNHGELDATVWVPANSDYPYNIPSDVGTIKARFQDRGLVQHLKAGDQLTIRPNGQRVKEAFSPPGP